MLSAAGLAKNSILKRITEMCAQAKIALVTIAVDDGERVEKACVVVDHQH